MLIKSPMRDQKKFNTNVGAMADGTRLSARPSNFDMVHLITLLLHQTGFRSNGENVLICSLSIPVRTFDQGQPSCMKHD